MWKKMRRRRAVVWTWVRERLPLAFVSGYLSARLYSETNWRDWPKGDITEP